MKIAILTSGILPVPAVQGGAVEYLTDLYLEYNNRHRLHDITVYSVWHPDVENHPALRSEVNHYVYIKTGGLWNKIKKKLFLFTHRKGYYHYTIEYFLNEAIRHLRQQQYDCILLENRPGYAMKLKASTDAKLIYHLHNEKLSTDVPAYQELYDAADRIITVSDYIKSCVKTINPDDTKTITVHNGIDLTEFSQDKNLKDRKTIGLHDDDFVLIFSGRVTREKGVMELIEVMNMLKDYTDIKLLVLGSSFYGNENNENSFAQEQKTKAAALQDRIIFSGFVPHSEIPVFLSMADVAVIPSVWDDPFPTTVLEVQAMGLPIITTRRGGIPEEVTADNAILLETDKHFVHHLATTVLDLYQHPAKREQMAAASLKRSKMFDKETYARNFFAAIADNT